MPLVLFLEASRVEARPHLGAVRVEAFEIRLVDVDDFFELPANPAARRPQINVGGTWRTPGPRVARPRRTSSPGRAGCGLRIPRWPRVCASTWIITRPRTENHSSRVVAVSAGGPATRRIQMLPMPGTLRTRSSSPTRTLQWSQCEVDSILTVPSCSSATPRVFTRSLRAVRSAGIRFEGGSLKTERSDGSITPTSMVATRRACLRLSVRSRDPTPRRSTARRDGHPP